jgi:hypothetical protein
VPRDDEPDVAAPQRVQERDVGVPADPEDVLDAVGLQLCDKGFCRGRRHFSPQMDMPRSIRVLTTV